MAKIKVFSKAKTFNIKILKLQRLSFQIIISSKFMQAYMCILYFAWNSLLKLQMTNKYLDSENCVQVYVDNYSMYLYYYS